MPKYMRYALIISSLVVIACWIAWAACSETVAHWASSSVNSIPLAGSWGDSFGPFSALFSALGFLGVIATLLLQGESLRQQQIDQHRQRFEATFFQLMDMLSAARLEVRFRSSKEYNSSRKTSTARQTVNSHEAIRLAAFEMKFWITELGANLEKAPREKIGNIYFEKIHSRYESTFGPYFRLIYNILWRIKNDNIIDAEEKRLYANLLRGHLTSFEVGLLAFNGLMRQAKDLDSLITEFRMLKYYPEGEMRDLLKKIYDGKAFIGSSKNGYVDALLEKEPLEDQDPND